MKRTTLTLFGLAAALVATVPAPPLPAAAPAQNIELKVLGSNTYLPGAPSALRIISYDAVTGKPVSRVPVEVELDTTGHHQVLFSGTTNTLGTLDTRFRMPRNAGSSAVLKVTSPALGGVALSSPVTIREDGKLYLTTDKPLYQPGQSVHVRMLALEAPDLAPAADKPCQIQIMDARGNVVFKKTARTSKFGVLSARFDLASEVNMGEYRMKATCGTFNAEKSFTVKRYVLPKFKVSVTTDKAWYQPSEKVHGHLQAGYFFGKPVAHAQVRLKVKTFDTSDHLIDEIQGVTDADGRFTFDFTLPAHFTGRPLDNGKAPLDLIAEVVDTGNHKEVGPLALSVVSSPVSVQFFPEGGNLQPNLANRVYVLCSYPDGKPATCKLSVKVNGKPVSVATDATGFGTFSYEPTAVAQAMYRGYPAYPTTVPVTYEAVDSHGQSVHGSSQFTQNGGAASVLLRPDKALYRVGDTLKADIYSTAESGTVYVDVVRDDQTLSTHAIQVRDHRAEISFPLAGDSFGSIALHAYQIGADQNIVRDVRRIFVQPARDLLVDVRMDKTTYRPGEDAKVTFVVKTKDGAPRLAVLGVDMVDESLFALAENQPGLEKVYFLLEKAMMEPKVEVHGFNLQDAVVDPKSTQNVLDQNLSRAALSAVDTPHQYALELSSYDTRVQLAVQRMQKLRTALYTYQTRHHHAAESLGDLVTDRLVDRTDITDPWGRAFEYRKGINQVQCAGPDGRIGTTDDVNEYAFNGPRDGILRREAVDDVEGGMMMPRVPMGAPMATRAAQNVLAVDKKDAAVHSEVAAGRQDARPTRVREYFPETLYTNPEVVTDENGVATVRVPLADSITSWRLSAFASSMHGELGNATSQVRVFQPFFVDIDLPAALTQDDEISVPVAVYNYLPGPQTVNIRLDAGKWFTPLDGQERTLHLSRNQVTVVYYRIRVSGLGDRQLTVHADGTKFSDAVRRTVEVEPNGEAFDSVVSDRLRGTIHQTFSVPKDAIVGASKLLMTVYPGVFAQVMEGMDAIFRMPNGCFEQTSSTTYPNVLVMDYLKKVNKMSPATQMKADGFINTGYQRLLTFEVKGGGFSVFGQYPANPILTAYGLMEFADMAKVHDVDPNLLARTKTWLLAQQSPDGSWGAGREGFYAEGWSNVPNSSLVATSYITWALLNTGEKGPQVQKAVAYVRDHMGQATEPYTAALVANVLEVGHDKMAAKALSRLAAMEVQDKDAIYWQTRIATAAFGTGQAGDIETTALATLAMENDPDYSDQVNKAITYLTRSKDRYGTWQSTQATVLALKALVGSIDKASENANATIAIRVNGKTASTLHVTPENSDVFHQVDLTSLIHDGRNDVDVEVEGKGSCQYRMVGTVYRPWSLVGKPKEDAPLALDVQYDRTHLSVDDTADCTVKVTNLTRATANQIVMDVGIPPGFQVQDEDLSALVEKHVIAKFSNTGRQLIVYLEKLDPSATTTLSYRVKARYPIKAQVPASSAYEYYDPSRHVDLKPTHMVVTK